MPTSPLVAAVRRSLDASGLSHAGAIVVSALSGGPDSVALLDALLKAAKGRGVVVVAAHLDHALRKDSEDDAAFCAELCERFKVRLRSGRSRPLAHAAKEGGIEEAARLARYSFLRRIAREEDARAIVLGHTLDDQAETVLMRLVRGSGSLGLSAMREWDGELLRPLLETRREAVLAHLSAFRLPYRTDPSNADTIHLRNRVRRELMPLLEKRFNPSIAEALGRTARTLAEEHGALRDVATALLERARASAIEGAAYELATLKTAPPGVLKTALREALRRSGGLRSVSFIHIERIAALVAAGRGGAFLALPGRRLVSIKGGRLVLTVSSQSTIGHSREKPFLS